MEWSSSVSNRSSTPFRVLLKSCQRDSASPLKFGTKAHPTDCASYPPYEPRGILPGPTTRPPRPSFRRVGFNSWHGRSQASKSSLSLLRTAQGDWFASANLYSSCWDFRLGRLSRLSRVEALDHTLEGAELFEGEHEDAMTDPIVIIQVTPPVAEGSPSDHSQATGRRVS